MSTDFVQLAKEGMPAEKLAITFLREYSELKGEKLQFPLNPFQMLKDLGVAFIFRPFKKYEGIYVPAEDGDDIPVVGININRPVVRQRFTAAHELCHHLKDVNSGFMCTSNPQSSVERYAENFAAELLMPSSVLRKQVEKYENNGYVEFDDVVKIADYFGVSFSACLYRIAYRLHKIKGDTSSKALGDKIRKYKPMNKRKEMGLYDTVFYEQLFDAIGDAFKINPTPYACQKFKTEYVFYDSRLEGVEIEEEMASDIVMDLRLYKQDSEYCKETNQNIIEVAGLTLAYDYVFEESDAEISIYDAKHINEKLYATSVFPEYGGRYRETNTLVLGAKFETIDYRLIPQEMYFLDKEVKALMDRCEQMSLSEYVENVIRIHHRLTVIHAFRDGNGRTSRAFTNKMLLKKNISPIFFKDKEKKEYKAALKIVDTCDNFQPLYERFYKSILISYSALTDFSI